MRRDLSGPRHQTPMRSYSRFVFTCRNFTSNMPLTRRPCVLALSPRLIVVVAAWLLLLLLSCSRLLSPRLRGLCGHSADQSRPLGSRKAPRTCQRAKGRREGETETTRRSNEEKKAEEEKQKEKTRRRVGEDERTRGREEEKKTIRGEKTGL